MPQTTRTIATSHADLRLTEAAGTGLPIVMLHGSAASRRVFDHQLAGPLGDRHRLIAIDLPGHGESQDAHDPVATYTLTGLADTMTQAIRGLGIDRFVLFGWSLGGHIGIEMLSRHPGMLGLMLSGAPPVAHGPLGMLRGFHASWDMLLASKEKFTPRDVERFAKLCYGDAVLPQQLEDIRRADGRVRAVFSRSMMRGDGADQKRAVELTEIPVAVVCGQHDPIVRLSYLSSVAYSHLWDAHVHILPGTGHAPFRDAPGQFDALLLRFAADAEDYAHRSEQRAVRRA